MSARAWRALPDAESASGRFRRQYAATARGSSIRIRPLSVKAAVSAAMRWRRPFEIAAVHTALNDRSYSCIAS